MAITAATLAVLLLLFPGLLASAVLNIARRPASVETTQRVVETLVFTLLVAVLNRVLLDEPGALTPVGFDGERLVWQDGALAWLVLSAGSALTLALLTSWVLSSDRHMALFRRLRITDRSSYESMWHQVFAFEGDRFIVVHLDDGRRVSGFASHYANDREEGSVFLVQPAWIEVQDGVDFVLPTGQYGMLVPGGTIRLIEFQFNEDEADVQSRAASERTAALARREQAGRRTEPPETTEETHRS